MFYFCVKKIKGLILSLLLLALLIGCAGLEKGVYQPLTPDAFPTVKIKDGKFYSRDKTIRISGKNVNIRGKIEWANYEPDDHLVLMNVALWNKNSGKEKVTLCVDLNKKKTIWASYSNPRNGVIFPEYYLLEFSDSKKLISRKSGTVVAEYPPKAHVLVKRNMWLETETDTLGTTHYVAKDLLTGQTLWTSALPGGSDWATWDGDKLYQVGNGLTCLDYSNGKTWSIESPTSATEGELKAVLLNTLSLTLAAMGGGYATLHGPDRISMLSSRPLIQDDRIYFAAMKNLYCVDKNSGKIIWHTQLDVEPSKVLIRLFGNNLLLFYTGIRLKNGAPSDNGFAKVLLVSTKDGHPLNEFEPEKNHTISDTVLTGNSIYLLSKEKVYLLDNNLRFISEITGEQYGDFWSFMGPYKSHLLIRSSKGILCLKLNPLKINWWKELPEAPKAYGYEELQKVNQIKSKMKFSFYFTDDAIWIYNPSDYTCLRLEDGKPLLTVPIVKDSQTSYINKGYLTFYHPGRWALLKLDLIRDESVGAKNE